MHTDFRLLLSTNCGYISHNTDQAEILHFLYGLTTAAFISSTNFHDQCHKYVYNDTLWKHKKTGGHLHFA